MHQRRACDGEVCELTNDVRKRVQLKARELSDNGMRVIAVAQRTDPHAVGEFSEQDECDMILIFDTWHFSILPK